MTFFEQIPVETVKRIAKEFSEENTTGSQGESTENEGRSPRESWRELAQQVQHERDSRKMSELVEQLIATLDQEELCKHLSRKRNTQKRSD
jgi:hypothetical protein